MNHLLRIRRHLSAAVVFALASSPAVGACDPDCELSRLLTEEGITGVVYGLVDGDPNLSGTVTDSEAAYYSRCDAALATALGISRPADRISSARPTERATRGRRLASPAADRGFRIPRRS